MKVVKWALFGSVAGAIGAGIWAAVALGTHREIGWIAWGIGGLVGLAVRLASHEDEGSGFFPGIVAVLIAVLAILVGKYAAVHFAVENAAGQMLAGGPTGPTDADMISSIADDVVDEFQQAKKKITWPPGVDPEGAHSAEAEYPKPVWAEAKKRWEAKPAAEREAEKTALRQQHEKIVDILKGHIRQTGFSRSFGPFDIIFFLLAVATAFKVGSGNVGSG